MSYAIIRNQKYKRENLKAIYKHNERKNKNYSNKNVDLKRSHLNYSIKSPETSTYEKEFERIREEYNLKGQIKTVSNIACEYIITSDKDFFDKIGQAETKRYFETAYKFVSQYKDLGEKYIISAKVHMDEQSPHMHLIYLPVVHTKDKKGNAIDKLACSEFWKAKDSYRQLQDAFYNYMVSNGFNLQRGLPKEETNRQHYSIEEYKKITNFEETKETLNNIKLELPDVPDIATIGRFTRKRDEKILEEIIKPKDDVIQNLYQDNLALHMELSRQARVIEEAEEYQKERDKILADNENLNEKVQNLEFEYKKKSNTLDLRFNNRKRDLEEEFKNKSFDLENKYKGKIRKLEKENSYLNKIIDKFYETIDKFINWICRKFDIAEEDTLIRDFQKETHTFINPEKQIKHENTEKELEL